MTAEEYRTQHLAAGIPPMPEPDPARMPVQEIVVWTPFTVVKFAFAAAVRGVEALRPTPSRAE